MKKVMSIFLTACFLLSLMVMPTAYADQGDIFSDDFETETVGGLPAKWFAEQNGTIAVCEETVDGVSNKFLRLTANKTWNSDLSTGSVVKTNADAFSAITLAGRTKNIVIKASLRKSYESSRNVISLSYPTGYTGSGFADYQLFALRENSFYGVGGDKATEYTAGQTATWYDVTAVIDTEGSVTVNFYNDGECVAQSVKKLTDSATLGTITEIANLTMRSVSQRNGDTLDLDNVSINLVKPEDVLFTDDFETETINTSPSNWTGDTSLAKISVQEDDDGNKFMRVYSYTTWSTSDKAPAVSTNPGKVYVSLEDRDEDICIEASMRMSSVASSRRSLFCLSYPGGSQGNLAYQLFAIRGASGVSYANLYNLSGSSMSSTQLLANTWYHILTVIKTDGTITYDVYDSNDKIVVTGTSNLSDSTTLSELDVINNLTLRTISQYYQDNYDLDNVSIYKGSPRRKTMTVSDTFENDTVVESGSATSTNWVGNRTEGTDAGGNTTVNGEVRVKAEADGNKYLQMLTYGSNVAPPVTAKMLDRRLYIPMADRTEKVRIKTKVRIDEASGDDKHQGRHSFCLADPLNGTYGYGSAVPANILFDFRMQEGKLQFGRLDETGTPGASLQANGEAYAHNTWYDVEVLINVNDTVDYTVSLNGVELSKMRGVLSNELKALTAIENPCFTMVGTHDKFMIDDFSVDFKPQPTEFEACNIRFTNAEGETVTSLENGTLQVKISYKNPTAVDTPEMIFAALYEKSADGILKLVEIKRYRMSGILSYFEEDTAIANFTITDAENSVAKIFVWDPTITPKEGVKTLSKTTVE